MTRKFGVNIRGVTKNFDEWYKCVKLMETVGKVLWSRISLTSLNHNLFMDSLKQRKRKRISRSKFRGVACQAIQRRRLACQILIW